jgi:rhodanese-related sulfurtransferase
MKQLTTIAFALALLGLPGCAGDPVRKEAHQWVESGARLVDVRTPDEYAAGHIEGAVNIPVQELPGRVDELAPKDAPVVVYCRSGARSASARRTLEAAGYTKVLDLGPMSRW